METRANYVLIGAFTLAAILGGLGFFIWLAKLQVNRQYDYYDVIFDNVLGIDQAADVRFNGLTVGQVVSIELSERFRGKVQVRIEVTAGTPITEGTQAQLQPLGVTGLSFVALTGGKPDAAPLRSTDGTTPYIMAKPSTLETLAEDAPSLIREGIALLKQLQSFVTGEHQAYVASILRNLEQASGKLQTALDDFSTISHSVADAAGQIGKFTGRLEPIGDSLQTTLSTADQTLEAARAAFTKGETALGSAERTFDDADRAIREQLPGILADLSEAVATLKTALAEISTDTDAVLGRFGSAADEATGRLAELETTIVNLDAALADARVTLASIAAASQSVDGLVKGDGTALVAQARTTLADVSASLERIDKVVAEDVPGVVADVRKAARSADQVITAAGANVTEFTAGLKPLPVTANTTLETATATMQDASATLARVDAALDTAERTLVAAEGTFTGARRVIDSEVGPTAANMRAAAAELEAMIRQVSSDLPAVTGELRGAIGRADHVIARVDTAVGASAGPIQEFATTGLPQFARFATEARVLVANLERLIARIERDPARFLLGSRAPDYRR